MNCYEIQYPIQLILCVTGAIYGGIQFHSGAGAFGVAFGSYSIYILLLFGWRTHPKHVLMSLVEVLGYAVFFGLIVGGIGHLFHHLEIGWIGATLALLIFYEEPKGAYRP